MLKTKCLILLLLLPNITNTALATVELKMKYLILVIQSKNDYNRNISEIENKITANHDHDKYIITQKISTLTSENFTARLK